jgi:hypothetical protein
LALSKDNTTQDGDTMPKATTPTKATTEATEPEVKLPTVAKRIAIRK